MSDNPKAENNLSSISFHVQRRKYVQQAYPLLEEQNGIDLWYGPKALYGKVNEKHIAQLISETNLKTILSSPDLLAADFVVDAFEELRRHVSAASRRGTILAQNSFIGMMTAQKAWRSAREEYDEHIKGLYAAFADEYLDGKDRNNKVVDLDSFLQMFLEYSKLITNTAPITFSGFIKSRYLSHAASGLIIELQTFPYDDDSLKFNKYYSSDHFEFYQNAARKFGFRVDYNSPWRLVADISSAEMRGYMKDYGISSVKSLFENYYYDAFKLEVYIIKKYLLQFYNDFANVNPIVRTVYAGSSQTPKIKSKVHIRQLALESSVDSQYDSFYWLRYYFNLREHELSKPLSRAQKNKKILEMANVHNSLDFNSALGYINRELMKLERS